VLLAPEEAADRPIERVTVRRRGEES
jgi:hypothetical protein